ncbi:MAG TPA: M12 family metallopeptidase [Flavobacterium sp.]|jgi:hypothetical protein
MEDIKICVDLNNEFDNRLFGLYNAYREREDNVVNESYSKIIGSDTLTEQLLIDSKKNADFHKLLYAKADSKNILLELALEKRKLWANGKVLKVKFLGGSQFLQENVVRYAREWENHANIKFNFTDSGDAEIRIAFMTGKGSWSCVGTDALNIQDQSLPTMNFGWFSNTTTSTEFNRTITHEFGHCLGCIHEHQSPDSKINWNKPAVYDYYKRTQTPPWDEAKVDNNIFKQFDQKEVTNSEFDTQSIMLYPIPAELTLDGFSVGMNNYLSRRDIEFIGECYPKT